MNHLNITEHIESFEKNCIDLVGFTHNTQRNVFCLIKR